MLNLAGYLVGAGELAIVAASLGFVAFRLRARLLSGWDGAPARLVEAVVAIALLIWLALALGSAGVLYELPLVGGGLVLGALAFFLARPAEAASRRPPRPETDPWSVLAAAGIAAIVFAHWGFEAKHSLDGGITNFDSLWYHMPFAAEFAQSGSTTGLHYTEPLFVNWLYPQNSELVHGVGLVLTDRDTLSLVLNLGWLALAMLAAWCVGRPSGRAPLTLAAAAVLLECHQLVVREPGAAKNDIVGIALVLAAAAILVNAWEARRSDDEEGLNPGWAIAVAGLAIGLAVGTKYTVLALAAGFTALVIALAPRGVRLRATAWWALPMVAGGAYWYVRNAFVAGNPIPQIRELGPIELPGPERLQEARPDFSVAHYLTDPGVWSEHFFPGLDRGFGPLWFLMLAAALAGAILAVARGPSRLHRGIGAVALLGAVAYLFMPLGAAGEEGEPVAFAFNLRFAIPPLILGLVLLPLAREWHTAGRRWALLGGLVALMLITNRADAVLRVPERVFGAMVATLVVLAPAWLLFWRSRGASRSAVGAGFAVLAVAAVAVGYPLQRDYLGDRFEDSDEAMHLDEPYRWAQGISEARIALAGTTAGFVQYGFYGLDLSNEVRYVGREGEDGAFSAIPTCGEFRTTLNAGEFDYLVTSPFLDFSDTDDPLVSPERWWVRGERNAWPVVVDGPVTVWRLRGPLDSRGCAEIDAPRRFLPGPGGVEISLEAAGNAVGRRG